MLQGNRRPSKMKVEEEESTSLHSHIIKINALYTRPKRKDAQFPINYKQKAARIQSTIHYQSTSGTGMSSSSALRVCHATEAASASPLLILMTLPRCSSISTWNRLWHASKTPIRTFATSSGKSCLRARRTSSKSCLLPATSNSQHEAKTRHVKHLLCV